MTANYAQLVFLFVDSGSNKRESFYFFYVCFTANEIDQILLIHLDGMVRLLEYHVYFTIIEGCHVV